MTDWYIFLLVAAAASCVGAISGIGGGVIIKPVLDSLGLLSVKEVSFISGCTVLTMAAVSLLRSIKSNVRLKKNITVFLAIGASIGGVIGKRLFEEVCRVTHLDAAVGMIQTILLLLINIFVLLYMVYRSKIVTRRFSHPALSIASGLGLGIVSSFLGIGGGPINIALLYYFYSMTPKETALNSLFIIFCSQLTSLVNTIVLQTVPAVPATAIAASCAGGVLGALIGSAISKKLSESAVEIVFSIALVVLIMLGAYNFFGFAQGF